jgi:hypothetical protein
VHGNIWGFELLLRGDRTEQGAAKGARRENRVKAMSEMIDSNGDGVFDASVHDQDQNGVSELMQLDANGDGYFETAAFDHGQNGVYDTMLSDTDGDGDTEVWMYDDNSNGVFERTVVDQNNDGAMDTFITDSNGDEVPDAVFIDANDNNVDDREEAAGVMVIGAPTNLDPVVNLIYTLVEETGQPVFGTPDTDHDGWKDNVDSQIYDPLEH